MLGPSAKGALVPSSYTRTRIKVLVGRLFGKSDEAIAQPAGSMKIFVHTYTRLLLEVFTVFSILMPDRINCGKAMVVQC